MNKRKLKKNRKLRCTYCNDVGMSQDGCVGRIERVLVGRIPDCVILEREINCCPYCGRDLLKFRRRKRRGKKI